MEVAPLFYDGFSREPYAASSRRGRMVAMCYTNEARPPLPPIMGGSTDEGDLVLTAADGNRFRAYAARAATPGGAAVVVIPDPRGVHPFYKDLVGRFAQAGVDAVVVDCIDRTAGMAERPENFDLLAANDQATTPEDFATFDRELTQAGVPHQMVVYEGAPHSFFDRTFEQHKDASADAWRQMLAFIKEQTRQPARA